ncbi:hypothetical protein [Sulfuricurvum sp.]|uniref:hypothetical protein n=1 Tax=Sulfuricurvum sp. TaxID=2025608 RepID=UPI0035619578
MKYTIYHEVDDLWTIIDENVKRVGEYLKKGEVANWISKNFKPGDEIEWEEKKKEPAPEEPWTEDRTNKLIKTIKNLGR